MRVYPTTSTLASTEDIERMVPMNTSTNDMVYIIPASYSSVTAPVGVPAVTSVTNSDMTTATQLFVLPFVSHPSHMSAPPPNFYAPFLSHAPPHPATYNDPPPEYESWLSSGTGITSCHAHSSNGPSHYTIPTSCSCCSHHVNYLNLEDRPQSQFGPNDEGQNLYPEIFHICGGHSNSGPGDNREADEESISTITETETPSIHHKSDTFVVKRWVFVLLIIALLITLSLCLGISLQHLQLAKKYFAAISTGPPQDSSSTADGLTSTSTTISSTTLPKFLTEESIILNLLSFDNSTSISKGVMIP